MTFFYVTGAGGFIGKKLCEALSKLNASTVAYSRSSNFDAMPGVESRRVLDYREVRRTHDNAVCFHLAGVSAPSEAEIQGARLEKEALDVAEHFLKQGFSRIVFASSAVVYEDATEGMRKESSPVRAHGAYVRMKLRLEEKMLASGHMVARIANSYGPLRGKSNVVSDILKQLSGRGPVVLENEFPVRDFIYISDVVRGLIALSGGDEGGIYNLGTGKGNSIRALAEALLRLSGDSGRGVLSKAPRAESSYLVLDSSKMKERFGWKAEVGLEEGLGLLLENQGVKNLS